MRLTVLIWLPATLAQQIFSLGLTAGDASPSHAYQPLIPQVHSSGYAIPGGIQPYSSPVLTAAMPMYSGYPSYYPGMYGMGYQPQMYQQQMYAPQMMGYGQQGYGMPFETHRPEGPFKRFWKGAADGVVAGGLGWLGRRK